MYVLSEKTGLYENAVILGWNDDKTYFLTIDFDTRDVSPSMYDRRIAVDSVIAACTPFGELQNHSETYSGTVRFHFTGRDNTYTSYTKANQFSGYWGHLFSLNTTYTGGRNYELPYLNCFITYNITSETGHWEGTVKVPEFYPYSNSRENPRYTSEWTVDGKADNLSAVQFGDNVAVTYVPTPFPKYSYQLSLAVTPSSGSPTEWILAENIRPDQTSFTAAIPIDAIAMMANTSSRGTATFKLTSMRGETINNEIIRRLFAKGVTSKTASISIPASIVPIVTGLTIAEAFADMPAVLAGRYIERESMLAVTVAASGRYGATITGYSTSIGGTTTYSGASFTSNPLTVSGQVAVSATVTDSRGRRATLTKTITVVPYHPPELKAPTIYRCAGASDASADVDGAFGCIIPSGSVSPIDGLNIHHLFVSYKKTTGSEYQKFEIVTQDYTFDTEYGIFAADVGASYDLFITLTDIFGNSATFYCTPLPATGALIEIGKDRRSIGIFQRVPSGQHGLFISGDVFLTGMQHEIATLPTAEPGNTFHDKAPSQFMANEIGGNKYIAIANYHLGDVHLTLCIDTGNLRFGVYKMDLATGIGTFTGL